MPETQPLEVLSRTSIGRQIGSISARDRTCTCVRAHRLPRMHLPRSCDLPGPRGAGAQMRRWPVGPQVMQHTPAAGGASRRRRGTTHLRGGAPRKPAAPRVQKAGTRRRAEARTGRRQASLQWARPWRDPTESPAEGLKWRTQV